MTEGLPERRYRPELHGLRGLAILLVALFHLFGQGRVSGGIDVFLVVSGFLFTGMLLREAATTGRIAVVPYIGRLARRLLPALLTVVAVTTAVAFVVLPESRRIALLREAAASVLYVENLELIHSQLAYEAAGSETSVFQHIWSLSVQGQFYLLWPLLTLLAVGIARRMGYRATRVLAVLAAIVIAMSFSFAVYMHHADQAVAYLHTGTRLWQLAFGALIALVGADLLPSRVRPVTGWMGVALIVSCGFFLDGRALFPGSWALWPVVGFALVMWSEHPARWGATRMLCLRPFAWIGDISYAFYLWHWPLLVLWLSLSGADHVGLVEGVAILVVSMVLAHLTLTRIERPMTKRLSARPGTAIAVGAVVVAVVATPTALAAGTLQMELNRKLATLERLTEVASQDAVLGSEGEPLVLDYPGARTLDPTSWVVAREGATRIPSLDILEKDQPDYQDRPCRQAAQNPGSDDVLVCDDPEHPKGSAGAAEMPTVVITGGSHAGQWAPAFRVLARQHGWRVIIVDKSGCQLTSNTGQYPRPRDVPMHPSCQGWNHKVVDVIADLNPDLVFTIATTSRGRPESVPLGFMDQWAALRDHGLRVVAIRDTPRIPEPLSECLDREDDPSDCAIPRSGHKGHGLAAESPFLGLEREPDVGYIDLADYYCPEDTCPAVIGNVVVYRDKSHLSASYVRTLVAPLSHALRRQAPYLYE